MRYVGGVLLVLAALSGVGLITGAQAHAAVTAAPPPLIPPPAGMTLAQDREGGTWSTSAYLDTEALCGETFDLVMGPPDTDEHPEKVTYDGGGKPLCGAAAAKQPVTDVELTFSALANGAIPQTATLVVTPSAPNMAAGADPVEIALTVRRQLSGSSSLLFTVWFGLGFVAALMLLVACSRRNTKCRSWRAFLGAELDAPSKKWTFGGNWLTSFTALGTALGGVLTATGTVSGMVPGVDLGRIGLLFAVAGASALLAPLVFAALNSSSRSAKSAGDTADVVATRGSMIAASCFTAFGVGAELGLLGWVLGAHLSAAAWWVHDVVVAATIVVAFLFLFLTVRSIREMKEHGEEGQAHGGEVTATAPASPSAAAATLQPRGTMSPWRA